MAEEIKTNLNAQQRTHLARMLGECYDPLLLLDAVLFSVFKDQLRPDGVALVWNWQGEQRAFVQPVMVQNALGWKVAIY
jgi:hypothetical protein